jgi:hypothetical protein
MSTFGSNARNNKPTSAAIPSKKMAYIFAGYWLGQQTNCPCDSDGQEEGNVSKMQIMDF